MNEKITTYFDELLSPAMINRLITTCIGVVVLWLVYFVVKKIIKTVASRKLKPPVVNMIVKILRYILYVLLFLLECKESLTDIIESNKQAGAYEH